MKVLFYYLLPALGAAILWVGITWFSAVLLRRGRIYAWVSAKRGYVGGKLRCDGWFVAPVLSLSVILAGGVVNRPILGLLSVGLLPLGYGLFTRRGRSRVEGEFFESALTFLVTLRAALELGLSLPKALFDISTGLDSRFAREVHRALLQFESGVSLDLALSEFQNRHRTGGLVTFLSVLFDAHRKGLTLSPLLGRFIPRWERELDLRRRIHEARVSACVQGLFAAAIPWMLLATLGLFQDEISLGSGSFWAVCCFAMIWEGMGVFALWKVSGFE